MMTLYNKMSCNAKALNKGEKNSNIIEMWMKPSWQWLYGLRFILWYQIYSLKQNILLRNVSIRQYMIGTCIGINDEAGINAKNTSYLGLTRNQRIGLFLPKLCLYCVYWYIGMTEEGLRLNTYPFVGVTDLLAIFPCIARPAKVSPHGVDCRQGHI